jgi:hypothetical protein
MRVALTLFAAASLAATVYLSMVLEDDVAGLVSVLVLAAGSGYGFGKTVAEKVDR